MFAHVALFPNALTAREGFAADSSGAPVTAADMLRGFNRPGGVAHTMTTQVAAAAKASAAAASADELTAVFASTGPAAITALRRQAPTDQVSWPGVEAPTAWAEAVRIVLSESVAHLLDVSAAIAAPADIPAAALTATSELRTDVADPVALIEYATGRSGATPFPVLR